MNELLQITINELLQMTLSADLEKMVKGMKDCSVAEIAEMCGSYSLHVQRALVWAITQVCIARAARASVGYHTGLYYTCSVR